ncbi:MAG: hypothetical protein PHG08_07385 [Bacilli bacterium]|jgi:hypothetical protein|nr:hypothetical protein [Bacilli bacterium]
MNKTELLDVLHRLKSGLLSQATDGAIDENEYKYLRNVIISDSRLKTCDINFVKSNITAKEFRVFMQTMFVHYVDRRKYINEKVNALIMFVEDSYDDIIYEKTGWDKIDESVSALLKDLNSISDRIDINEIGVRCRETIILLANIVYIEDLHHPLDFPGVISKTDAKRKIDGYLEYTLGGSSNEAKRKYAKACNDLANYLTHSSSLTERDAKLGIVATVSLIQLIKIIYSY